ncbi:PadR family transcriptional regulator [Photobacterium leiognathi]|uniref:PadR family transcriptional regulator n=1 Tax=Photobacterium leiognathi TaxID=553611 RepID=UPI00298270F1|nr:PadR family transcriptional regulator [Photobacterium leiognathi]
MHNITSTVQIASLFSLRKSNQTGYNITKILQSTLKTSHQQVYRELNKLEALGVINSVIKPNEGKPDARIYSFTKNYNTITAEIAKDNRFWSDIGEVSPRDKLDLFIAILDFTTLEETKNIIDAIKNGYEALISLKESNTTDEQALIPTLDPTYLIQRRKLKLLTSDLEELLSIEDTLKAKKTG